MFNVNKKIHQNNVTHIVLVSSSLTLHNFLPSLGIPHVSFEHVSAMWE